MNRTWILGVALALAGVAAIGGAQPPYLSDAKDGKYDMTVGSEEKEITETTLPFHPSTKTLRDLTFGLGHAQQPTAIKVYRFKMAPGESLHFRLKVEKDNVILAAYCPSKNGPLSAEIQKVNQTPFALRTHDLSITNPSNQAEDFVLLAYGQHGYPYTLSIEHKKAGH